MVVIDLCTTTYLATGIGTNHLDGTTVLGLIVVVNTKGLACLKHHGMVIEDVNDLRLIARNICHLGDKVTGLVVNDVILIEFGLEFPILISSVIDIFKLQCLGLYPTQRSRVDIHVIGESRIFGDKEGIVGLHSQEVILKVVTCT